MVEFEKLSGKVISQIEAIAKDSGIESGKRGYKTAVAKIASDTGLKAETINAILTKQIGEVWKSLKPTYPNYKLSNFGRVVGKKGVMLSSYHAASGTEVVDPYTNEGKRKHLVLKTAVAKAFLKKPKKNEKIRYKTSNKINTVHNIVVA